MTTDVEGMSGRTIAAPFVAALERLERDGDVEAMASLYRADGVAGNVLHVDGFHGVDGVREFWGAYRSQFGEISSTFENVIEDGERVALEWSSIGTINGRRVEYRGVTVLEANGGALRRTCAYFDPKALA
jgi:predicted ester cyclase